MDVPEAQDIPDSTVEELCRLVDPEWELERTDPAERGFCSVYRVVLASDGVPQDRYLKVSPDGGRWGIPDEARVQAVLDAHTSIPVPEVYGVVDDHNDLPSPFYLMQALPGEELAYECVSRFDDHVLRRLARETGEYLGELHSVPAVDRFGHVRHDDSDRCGGAPDGDPTTLTVGDPYETWPVSLRAYLDRELDRHADSPFAVLTSELREWFSDGISDVVGPFEPVLGRNDHGLHNLLIDPDTGAITGMLDWGYTLAVPAAFDFEFAVYLYSGAFLAGVPAVSDRRSLVREAMLEGYRTTAPDRVEAVSSPEPLYEVVAMVRIMNDFQHLSVPNGAEEAAIDRIRADVRALIE